MSHFFLAFRMMICKLTNSPSFIIKIENGTLSMFSGTAKKGFMNDCLDIVSTNNIESGFIYAATGNYGKSTINASSEIPKNVLQQLRNVYSFNA